MSLKITYSMPDRELAGGNTFSGTMAAFKTHDATVKILIADKNRNLIPCNYKGWVYADDYKVCGGNLYIPVDDKKIDPKTLIEIKKRSFISKKKRG